MAKKKTKKTSQSTIESKDPVQRKVMIATPAYDGRIDAWYNHSLLLTERACAKNNILIDPIYVCYDALVEKARNDLFAYAYENNYDDLVYIDADISWDPQQFLRLLSHPVDFVAGIYPKKSEIEDFPVNLIGEISIQNGLMEVASVPTGFLRLSKNAINILWKACPPYTISQDPKVFKHVFQTGVLGGRYISEDILTCLKWRELGNKVYLDPFISVAHSGHRTWRNNFMDFLNKNAVRNVPQSAVAAQISQVQQNSQGQ